MSKIHSIKLPDGTLYQLKDNGALPLTGGTVTGNVNIQSSLNANSATIGDLVVNGSAIFNNGLTGELTGGATKASFLESENGNNTYRAVRTQPSDYYGRNSYGKLIFRGLKNNANIDSPSTTIYSHVLGLYGWHDDTAGNVHEIAFNNDGIFVRQSTSSSNWGSWEKLLTSSSSIPLNSISNATDLKAIENLIGTGFLKRVGEGSWTTDGSTYLKYLGLKNCNASNLKTFAEEDMADRSCCIFYGYTRNSSIGGGDNMLTVIGTRDEDDEGVPVSFLGWSPHKSYLYLFTHGWNEDWDVWHSDDWEKISAGKADKWTDPQKVYVQLSTVSMAEQIQGGSSNAQAIGVNGILGVANGGTGKINGKDAANFFLDSLDAGSSTPIEGDTYIASYADGKNTAHNGTNTYHRRPISKLWEYMKGKADTSIASNSTSTNYPTSKAVADLVSSAIATADAMIFKGTLGTGGTVTVLPTTYKTGWTYRVITAGTYAGNVCEIGDLIIALVDRSGSGNINSDWTVAQTNIDGAITTAGGTINGVLTVDNQFNANSATLGNLIVNGNSSFVNTINGTITNANSVPLSGVTNADDLKAIEGLTGTSGFLKKTNTNAWTLDTNNYVTSSGVTKVTAGTGLKVGTASSGGDITTTGTINHINSVTAQTTQAVYPIKIDAQGHISAYGNAVVTTIATSTATNQLTLSYGTKYSLTAAGASYIFTMPTAYSLPAATSDTLGGIKIGYSVNNKNYPVQLSDGKAYVSVPWTDTWKALSTSQAGYVSQAPNDANKFLNGKANWATFSAGSLTITVNQNDKKKAIIEFTAPSFS